MSRREMLRGASPLPPPSKCAKVLYYTWKLCSVVFSHFVMISLVVAYCILGAVTFEKLEAQYEKEVKRNISKIRDNTTESIWSMTYEASVLNQTNWTAGVAGMLRDFENAILLEMKVRGWDGNESTDHIQWTFTGALFYSIIVITTIGYGHIAPKTQSGKVVTIFYAIIGIPLMLLCLSNIGDVMASSFRFLYWRVCCYVCTRPPPRRRHHHRASMRRSIRGNTVRGSVRRRRPAPAPLPAPLERSHSDTDCRYRDSGYSSGRGRRARAQPPAAPAPPRTRSQPPTSYKGYSTGPKEFQRDRSPARPEKCNRDTFEDGEEEEFPKISLPLQDLEAALKQLDEHHVKNSKPELRSKSLPRPPKTRPEYGPRREFDERRHFDDDDDIDILEMHDLHDVDYENYKERKAREMEERDKRRLERSDFPSYSYKDRDRGYDPEDDDYEFDCPRPRKMRYDRDRRYRGRSEYYEREHDDYFPARRGRRARSAMCDYEKRWDDDYHRRNNWEEDRRHDWSGNRRDDWDDRRDNWRDDKRYDWSDNRRDVETGRRRLRRLQTIDDSRMPHRYTPSPDRDDWSDEIVVPRRSRPPATWGSRPSEMYALQQEPAKEEIKPVPIWLCVCLVASYIVAGTFLFKRWEGWAYLDAAYFCFITLTTIGFGDFVPAQGQFHTGDAAAAVHSIALCSLYLLFGIALLAMSFNLVQEEVRANVAALATKLGIIKPKDREESDEDY